MVGAPGTGLHPTWEGDSSYLDQTRKKGCWARTGVAKALGRGGFGVFEEIKDPDEDKRNKIWGSIAQGGDIS